MFIEFHMTKYDEFFEFHKLLEESNYEISSDELKKLVTKLPSIREYEYHRKLKILKNIHNKLINQNITSRVKSGNKINCYNYHCLYIFFGKYDGCSITFSMNNSKKLIIAKEKWKYNTNYYNFEIGEATIENVLMIIELFVNYGKINNPENPSIIELWKNNRFHLTKSANTVNIN